MSDRYPNANYPTAYTEADMAKATDVPVNVAGTGLTVTDVAAPYGPLMEHAMTGADVEGTTLTGKTRSQKTETAPVVEEEAPSAAPEPVAAASTSLFPETE